MVTYLEKVDSIGPAIAAFSTDGAVATLPLFVDFNEIQDVLVDLLGSVTTAGNGTLNRTLPKAHPQFTWLYADSVTSIQGLGAPSLVDAEDALEAEPIPEYAAYPMYLVQVQFKPRPYAVLDDSVLSISSANWTLPDGTTEAGIFTNEYCRFTDFLYEPNPELITSQQGQFKFRTSGGVPDGRTFTGRPKILIPGQKFIIRWYMIPYAYVENPVGYITRFQGTVNQTSFLNYDPGTVLYVAPQVLRRYTRTVPQMEFQDQIGVVAATKLCDVDLVFQYTGKTATSPPTPANANFIADGHNVHAAFDLGKFYYTSADGATEYPTYFSAPHQLLFTDPDA